MYSYKSTLKSVTMAITQFVILATILYLATSSPAPFYKPLSPEDAQLLAAWTPENKQPMWELSGQYEGDIVVSPYQQLNGVINTRLRWPNRVIPYEISSDFTAAQKQTIANTLKNEFAKTCVSVRPRKSTDKDYVYVTGKNTGCWSYVGRRGKRQTLNLQKNGCVYYGIIVHEFLHAAGFYHQQGATERDKFVTILWQNIISGYESAFKKYGSNVITSFGQKYDYSSIMHYSKYAFSKNNKPTIEPKDPNAVIGQRSGLSSIDVIKLNKMYSC